MALLVGAGTLGLGGCARISAPTGGEADREPPQVISTEPEHFAVVPGWDRPVVIQFDERISERGIDGSVLVSPETGSVRVSKGRSSLRVSLEGGWRPGQIYRVVLLPVIQDLFNNVLAEEVELIFSTGPEIPATALAGLLTDRLTGDPVAGARVEALGVSDSVRHLALSDTAGFFALRHIPPGRYSILAYLDRNRNQRLDFGEPEAEDEIGLGASDTVVVSYSLLAADTTPANLVLAEERDSLELLVRFDDHLDPELPLDGVEVGILSLPDSIPVVGARLRHLHEVGGEEETDPVEELLPIRELVVMLEEPLARESRFEITISGVRNINGIGGGGGSVILVTGAVVEPEEPEGVDLVPDDTTGVGGGPGR